jgi:hypothetical protein
VTLCLRGNSRALCHNGEMENENHIAPIVEIYIPDTSHEEKLALTAEFFSLFDALDAVRTNYPRFDTLDADVIESDSRKEPNFALKL